MKALQIIFGVILLLPGICSLGFMILFLPQIFSSSFTDLMPLWIGCFAVAGLGVFLIRKARNSR